MKVQIKALPLLLTAFFLTLLSYAVFSYSLTDPNLVLSSNSWYWQFQQFMWGTFFENRVLLTRTYGLLIGALFALYFVILWQLRKNSAGKSSFLTPKENWKHRIIWYLLLISPLFFAYNALSHDVFNYIFNAKMVVVYGANPHKTVALEFMNTDDWTRFMHNTHTPAPYGYGWTALSLLPFVLGLQKFLSTWLLFKAWSVLSIGLLYAVLQKIQKSLAGRELNNYELALVFLNPLLLLEVVGNAHNDLWMMAPTLAAFYLLLSLSKVAGHKRLLYVLAAVGLWIFSISIKLATVLLFPVGAVLLISQVGVISLSEALHGKLRLPARWFGALIDKVTGHVYKHLPTLASWLMFVPLFTSRSQQFLPWYWLWILVWLPWIKWPWWRTTVILFSVTSMYRYLPWLSAGGYSPAVLEQEKAITWLLPAAFFTFSILRWLQKYLRAQHDRSSIIRIR